MISVLRLLLVPAMFLGITASKGMADPPVDYLSRRMTMVENQIQKRGVQEAQVLNVLRKVPRHLFVPQKWRSLAYDDRPLPIGYNQTISQPYMVALMTDLLDVRSGDKILEIGTGSGYQAAILAELADTVFTIEIVEPLGLRAEALLDSLGYANVVVRIGDGYAGWPEHAPFDAVIVTCAPTDIPLPLQLQLKEGGRMVIPVGEAGDQSLVYLVKEHGVLRQTDVIPVRFVPMVDRTGRQY